MELHNVREGRGLHQEELEAALGHSGEITCYCYSVLQKLHNDDSKGHCMILHVVNLDKIEDS